MRNDDEMRDDMSGTTAVVVLIKNKKIYCGWLIRIMTNNICFVSIRFQFFRRFQLSQSFCL